MIEAVIAGVLSLAHAPSIDPLEERPRLESFATSIAEGVGDAGEVNPFQGEDSDLAFALALVAIAKHESDFSADVIACRRTGDRHKGQDLHEGPSITAFQLKGKWAWGDHSREELCESPRLAAEQAARVFALHGKRCSTKAPLAWFQGYAGGWCGRPSFVRDRTGKLIDAGEVRCKTWERLAVQAGLSGARCDVNLPIERTDGNG